MKNDLTTTDGFDEALRRFRPMDPTEALRRLQALVQTAPFLEGVDDRHGTPTETLQWLGQLQAVVSAMKLTLDEMALRLATNDLVKYQGMRGAGEIRVILHRVLAAAELQAPASEQGAFIAVGQKLDAYASISKVLASASGDLLVIDPYMDGKALTDFMPGAAEGVTLRVVADEASVKPSLAPAAENWAAQFGAIRPLAVRLAPARSLHDRLIVVDGRDVWSLTQSLKDFANRAPGSILKVDPETAALKIAAYEQFWSAAQPI
jgi:hypothetical protein